MVMLQRHLAKVKLSHAEREHELVEQLRAKEEECAAMRADYEIARDELQLCWSFVDQLKKENTLKWRCEERDDWKALVTSIQEDRARLLRENATLRRRLGDPLDEDDKAEDVIERSDSVYAAVQVNGATLQLKKPTTKTCPQPSTSFVSRLFRWRLPPAKNQALVLLV